MTYFNFGKKQERFSYLRSVKGGSDFGSTKGKTHVSRVSSSDGVHGKTTSLVGGSGKSSLGISIDSSGLKFSEGTNSEFGWSAESRNSGGGNSGSGNRKRGELHCCIGFRFKVRPISQNCETSKSNGFHAQRKFLQIHVRRGD